MRAILQVDMLRAAIRQYGLAMHEVGRAGGRGAGRQERAAKQRADSTWEEIDRLVTRLAASASTEP